MAFWGQIRFLGGKHGSLGDRHGWGVLGAPPKPQLALGTSENKGGAQSPLVLRLNPHLPSIRVPCVCQSLDFGLGIAVLERPRCPARHPRGLWGVAPHCLRCRSPFGALGTALFGIVFLSRRGWAEQPLQGSVGALSHPPEPLWLFQSHFLVGFSSEARHFSRGERAGPGCLVVHDLNSKECSEQEQKGSRECYSAERGWEITPGSPGMSFVLGWLNHHWEPARIAGTLPLG